MRVQSSNLKVQAFKIAVFAIGYAAAVAVCAEIMLWAFRIAFLCMATISGGGVAC